MDIDNSRGEEMKRVIGLDLWGTLIGSSWSGETYEDRYAKSFDRKRVQAIARNVLMTEMGRFITEGHEGVLERLGRSGYGPGPLTYSDLQGILYRQLYTPEWRNGQSTPSPRHLDPSEVTSLWQGENEAVYWLPGALATLEGLQQDPDNILILVSNTTEPGW
ncbi:MAG TPA: hypothetical protein VJB37_00145, partial [Patescibacteria group bacterium]|nr:hypothetical protein [Patescibacteria group bacterium]